MINPADWNYLLIGAGLSFAMQLALITGRDTLPLVRIIISSCSVSAIAAFCVNGILILAFSVPPLASMFIGGLVGFVGGDIALKQMIKQLAKRFAPQEINEDLYQTLIDVKATMTEMQDKNAP